MITDELSEKECEKTLASVENFLRETIQQFGPLKQDNRLGRKRILPELALWSGLFVCILHKKFHQNDIWRLLTQECFWDSQLYDIGDQAVYKRLDKKNDALPLFFDHVSALLRERLQPYALRLAPAFSQVYAIDATKLEGVKRLLPSLRDLTSSELLAGQIHGAFDLRLQQWARILHVDQPAQNEKVTFFELSRSLQEGSLLLFDRGYFSFPLFDQLTDSGYFWITRQREKSSFEVLHTYYEEGQTRDALVWLGKYNADKAKHAVRLLDFELGNTRYSYITNVTDPNILSLREVAELYMRRWDIEMAFRTLKQYLGLHFLNSSKGEVLWHQIWATLTIAQVIQGLRLEIASKAEADVFDVSMELLCKIAPALAKNGRDPVQEIVMRGRFAKIIRPSRRTKNKAPDIPLSKYNLDIKVKSLERKPRYAGKK